MAEDQERDELARELGEDTLLQITPGLRFNCFPGVSFVIEKGRGWGQEDLVSGLLKLGNPRLDLDDIPAAGALLGLLGDHDEGIVVRKVAGGWRVEGGKAKAQEAPGLTEALARYYRGLP